MMSRLLTVRQVAEYAGVTYQTALDWICAGHLPSVKLPARREDGGGQRRKHLVDKADVDRLIEASKTVPKVVPINAGTSGQKRTVADKDWYLKYK